MIDTATRLRLLPAIKVIATGRVIVGKRGEVHTTMALDLPGGPMQQEGVWERGFYDPLTKHWLHFSEIPDGIYDGESETARTIREMR